MNSRLTCLASVLCLTIGPLAAQVAARDIFGRPDFFDQGQENLDQEIQRLQTQPASPVLTIDAKSLQWQPMISRAGGFSIWMPPGVLSQETKALQTKAGSLNFEVMASQFQDARYVAAYANLSQAQAQQPESIYTAVRDEIIAKTSFSVASDRPISLANYPGRELVLQGGDETITFKLYLVQQRLYILGATQGGTAPSRDVTTFLNSFQLTR